MRGDREFVSPRSGGRNSALSAYRLSDSVDEELHVVQLVRRPFFAARFFEPPQSLLHLCKDRHARGRELHESKGSEGGDGTGGVGTVLISNPLLIVLGCHFVYFWGREVKGTGYSGGFVI